MEKVVILGKEVVLSKGDVLNFISNQLGKSESCSMINGSLFLVSDVLLYEEKELMLNVVQALEKGTNHQLSDCIVLENDLNKIFERNLELKVSHVLEYFFPEHVNFFQREDNPLFQKKISMWDSFFSAFSFEKIQNFFKRWTNSLFQKVMLKKEGV